VLACGAGWGCWRVVSELEIKFELMMDEWRFDIGYMRMLKGIGMDPFVRVLDC